MVFKLSNLNSNLALTVGHLNPALNNSAQGSYNQGFLQPVLLTTRGLTTRGRTSRGSYKQGFLQPLVLQPGVLTTGGLKNEGF